MKKIFLLAIMLCITNLTSSQTANSFSQKELKQYLNKQIHVKLKGIDRPLNTSCNDTRKRTDFVSKVEKNYIEIVCPAITGRPKKTTRILISQIAVITLE